MSNGTNVTVNAEHKDRLFNFIFGREENRSWTLSLYNAVNGSDHEDESLIEFNTLEDVMYLSMKNDTSFLIGNIMSVYEHQSTFNPNMPLRLMEYVGRLYSGYISRNKFNKYGEKLIPLPTPKLVVFYNGLKEQSDEMILRLSDSFKEDHRGKADIEVKVRMLNVNYGRNNKLMDKCKPLAEYAWFIDEIRNNRKEHDIEVSVKRVIDLMPDSYIIKNFLIGHRIGILVIASLSPYFRCSIEEELVFGIREYHSGHVPALCYDVESLGQVVDVLVDDGTDFGNH